MRILGIDHNTHTTGVCVIDFSVDEFYFEKISILFLDDITKICKKKHIQERLYLFRLALEKELKYLIEKFNPDFIVKEQHDPYGTKSNQMFMSTGILDSIIYSFGYSFENKKYFQITPAEWRGICLMGGLGKIDKESLAGKEEYCKLFYNVFMKDELLLNKSSDCCDAFGLSYSLGILESSKKSNSFFLALDDVQKKILKTKKGFKEWC